jgi:LuxR family maltose regulon positive regulatory protein
VAVADATLGSSLLWLGTGAEEADASLAHAIALAAPGENMIATLRALGARALLHLELGDVPEARRLAAQARAVRDRHGLGEYSWAAMTSLAEGRLAERDGDLAAAGAAFERAAQLAERGHVTPEIACAAIRLALVRATERRHDEARSYLRRARSALDGAADAGMLVHALTAAERAAGPSRAGEGLTDGHEELTERELGVLRMLASSLTQREIASALYVSVNTLKTHTRTIYRKLDASSRVDAVARSRERGLL